MKLDKLMNETELRTYFDWFLPKIIINATLSATLAKSGPLAFPSEKSFLLFFAHEEGSGHMFQK